MAAQTQDVTGRINKRFDELYRRTESGLAQPYVCLVCDELLKPKQVKSLSITVLKKNSAMLKPSSWNSVSPSLAECYRYTGDCGNGALDTQEYQRVAEATQKVLSKLRSHQSDRSEAVKRLLSASFAHQKVNIVGGAMASYLIRNNSRFMFSHKTVWCPLRDINALLQGEQVGGASIVQHGGTPFFQCAALHYLC